MSDLKDPRLIICKGLLFIATGLLSTTALMVQALVPDPPWRGPELIAFHVIAVWAFCRAYYFAFYVIHHYIDERYHFAGLWSAAAWLLTRVRSSRPRRN